MVASGVDDTAVVLAAYLVGSSNLHHGPGSFVSTATGVRGLYDTIDNFIGMSPGLCRAGVQVHIVHDVAGAASAHRGVVLHAFAPDPSFLGGDRRWGLYLQALSTLRRWSCAWALDMDVAALVVPWCSALRAALHLGSDACSWKIKTWLQRASRHTLLNATWGAHFTRFLHDRQQPYNSGIVGGRREVFLQSLNSVVSRLEAHRASGPPLVVGADMLLWNWAALGDGSDVDPQGGGVGVRSQHGTGRAARAARRARAATALPVAATAVVTGYPNGPVNWPMWAKLPRPSTDGLCPATHACNSQCGYAWLNSSITLLPVASRVAGGHIGGADVGAPARCCCGVVARVPPSTSASSPPTVPYWFGHKLPRSWLNLLRLHACWPLASGTPRAAHALALHGARKFVCECSAVSSGAPDRRTPLFHSVSSNSVYSCRH